MDKCEKLDPICRILAKYNPDDVELFASTVDELCQNGVRRGCYQNYGVLVDILSILSCCETLIKNEFPERSGNQID